MLRTSSNTMLVKRSESSSLKTCASRARARAERARTSAGPPRSGTGVVVQSVRSRGLQHGEGEARGAHREAHALARDLRGPERKQHVAVSRRQGGRSSRPSSSPSKPMCALCLMGATESAPTTRRAGTARGTAR